MKDLIKEIEKQKIRKQKIRKQKTKTQLIFFIIGWTIALIYDIIISKIFFITGWTIALICNYYRY